MTANTDTKVSTLPGTTSVSNTDLFLVTRNISSTPTSNSINFANFVESISGYIPGPYSSDSVANTAGVPVGSFYYNSAGTVQIRLS